MLPWLFAHEVDGVSGMLVVIFAQRNDLIVLRFLAHTPPLDTDRMVARDPAAAFVNPFIRHRAGQFGYAGKMGGVLFHPLILRDRFVPVNFFPTFS